MKTAPFTEVTASTPTGEVMFHISNGEPVACYRYARDVDAQFIGEGKAYQHGQNPVFVHMTSPQRIKAAWQRCIGFVSDDELKEAGILS